MKFLVGTGHEFQLSPSGKHRVGSMYFTVGENVGSVKCMGKREKYSKKKNPYKWRKGRTSTHVLGRLYGEKEYVMQFEQGKKNLPMVV